MSPVILLLSMLIADTWPRCCLQGKLYLIISRHSRSSCMPRLMFGLVTDCAHSLLRCWPVHAGLSRSVQLYATTTSSQTVLISFCDVAHACRSGQECFKPWHYLCSRLTFLVQEVLRYATIDVLEPLWEALEAAMKRATSMDEVSSLESALY
jgi:hypothetical protein